MSAIGREHHETALMLSFEGKTGKAIGEELGGLTSQVVNRFLKEPASQVRLAEMRAAFDAEVGRMGAEAVRPALEFQVAVARGDYSTEETPGWERASIADRQRASDSIQDRYGRSRGAKVELSGSVAQPAKLDLSKLTRAELADLRRGKDVEVTPGAGSDESGAG